MERTGDGAARRLATFDALGAIGLWSTLAVLGIKLKRVPPFLLVGAALLIGALWGVRAIRLKGIPLAVHLLGVYGLFAYHFCLFLALRLAPPVEANLINYLWPLLIVVLSPVFIPGTVLTARHVLGALLGFTGAGWIVSGGSLGFSVDALAGYALALAAAFIWSTYSLLTRRMGHFPTSTVATFCLVSGVLSLVCHALFESTYVPSISDLPYIVWIGLGPMGGAFYLWDRAMKQGDPRVIGTLSYLTPVLSTLLITVFGEGHLTRASAIAMPMVVGGAALGTWSRARYRPT
jgi:drug/metabolite transporter (DMT)-like permease